MGGATNSGALTKSVFYILLQLHQLAHDYVTMKNIAEMTDERVNLRAGSLYGAPSALQKKGWARTVDEHLPSRRIKYTITGTGKQFFERELIRLEEMLQNAEKMKEVGNKNKC